MHPIEQGGAALKMRLILLAPLLALFAFVATTEQQAEAVSFGAPVQGELMESQPTGTSVVNDPMYQEGQALKFFSNGVTATETVTFPANSGLHDVELLARAGQSGGSPTLTVSVNGTPTTSKEIINNGTPAPYAFDVNAPSGPVVIGVQADNTATGRNAFVDVLSFPSSGSDPDGDRDADGISDGLDNCSDVSNPGQRDDDGDGVGNACDQCDNDPGPAPTGCPTDPGGVTPPSDWPSSDCEKDIKPGADIDNVINSDASDTATTFCVYGGMYQVSAPAILKTGDKLKGEPGTVDTIDLTRTTNSATKPTPKAKLVGSGTDNLLRARGTGISISWVDLSGAKGTGTGAGAITAGSAGSDFLVEYSRIHDNASLGISNMKGRVLHSEFFANSNADSSLGFNGSAVKGITEYEAGYLYVHDEQGNGLWCDVGCSNDPARVNGFWVHDSMVINSNRAGIRYENSPNQALFENNEIHGNGKSEKRGGIDIRDSQNATVRNNNLGKAIIAGVTYLVNGDRIGVRATDSGRSDRVNLAKIKVEKNNFGLTNNTDRDRIVTCSDPRGSDPPVACSNDNTNVGS
jgi:hypothetical protein